MRKLGVGNRASATAGLVLAVPVVAWIAFVWTIGAAVAHASPGEALAFALAHLALVGAIALLLVVTRTAALGWMVCLAFVAYAEFFLDIRGSAPQSWAFNLAMLGGGPLLLAIPSAYLLRRAKSASNAEKHA